MTTKASMAQRIADEFDISRKAAAGIIEAVSALITEDIKDHGVALIPGVGKLKVAHRNARPGRNPRTGETIQIAARRAVRFRAGASLKRTLT